MLFIVVLMWWFCHEFFLVFLKKISSFSTHTHRDSGASLKVTKFLTFGGHKYYLICLVEGNNVDVYAHCYKFKYR